DYKKRYSVKPGLTGWAQVNYKASNTVPEAQKKLVYDLYYIENMSIFLDIKILIMTLRKIL
ncbi:MAG TPA: hypothetical protein ENI61_01790, partial [Ignavibacteria bacterium]|nr:hypothetical protein [Ignavibacteria bacterium]